MRPGRLAIAGGAVAIGVVVVTATTLIVAIGKDQRKDLDVVTGFDVGVYLTSDREDVADTTENGRCAGQPSCVQAAESSRVRVMRFDSRDSAERYVLQLAPHGYQSDCFVVDFLEPDTMTREEYRFVESIVYGTASDSPD